MTKYILLLIAATLASCAHQHVAVQPQAVGYFAVIHPGKSVYCVSNDHEQGLSGPQCVQVQAALAEINMAAGFTLLRFDGWRKINLKSDLPDTCDDIILVGKSALPGSAIGITAPRCMQGAYLLGTLVVFDPVIWANPRIEPMDVMVHEFLHAIGQGHADKEGVFPSQMEPVYQPKLHGLTRADIVAIRNTYK
jgi:hypothetical protein